MIKHKYIGKDIVSSVVSKVPIELHMRTTGLKKYSFCGQSRPRL
jgi:hypothetical protein